MDDSACNAFDASLAYVHYKHAGNTDPDSDPCFFGNTTWRFKAALDVMHADRPQAFTNNINGCTYNRYFGNLAHVIAMHLTSPMLVHYATASRYVTPQQAQNMLHTTFRLCWRHGLDHTVKNYYGDAPHQTLMLNATSDAIPSNLRPYIRTFLRLFRYGPDVFVVTIQRAVRAWIHKRRMKRAVETFEKYWFEVVNSPYTPAGARLLQRRSMRWQELAACCLC